MMDFKFDSSEHASLKPSPTIPEHLRWILQDDYQLRSYAEGKFGKLVLQRRNIDGFDLRIYYIEIWRAPMHFYIINDERFSTVYANFKGDVVFLLNENKHHLLVKQGDLTKINVPAGRHAVLMENQGFYLSWHFSAHKSYERKFLSQDYVDHIRKKYLPNIDFSKADEFVAKVPLE